MIKSLGHVANPAKTLADYQSADPLLLHFSFSHHQSYLDGTTIELTALCLIEGQKLSCSVFREKSISLDNGAPAAQFERLLRQHNLSAISLREPWRLETCRIAKPWGAEVWYTGIEQRGICSVSGIPLPWLIELDPEQSLGESRPKAPLLLKILDPLPDENLGDLYFELHEEKIEVYVVTYVDTSVWPDKIGQIRYGFSQTKRSAFESDAAFKAAYIAAVKDYQKTRNEIDQLLDQKRLAHKMPADTALPPELLNSWTQQLPAHLIEQEAKKRELMYSFTHLRNIAVGDVIKVEPFFPHSLQHGVRVIEFQTAHYERHILSFAQKVLTQNHWDTEAAMTRVLTTPAPDQPLRLIDSSDSYQIEEIADFGVFKSHRIQLEPHSSLELDLEQYCLVIGISGEATVNQNGLEPEAAFLIPHSAKSLHIETIDKPVTLLIASP